MNKLVRFTLVVVAWVVLALVTVANTRADEFRLEAGLGACRYSLAQEGSWWYDGYRTDTKLTTPCHQVGLSWLPAVTGGWKLGGRLAYVNLGTVKANNSFPAVEDGSYHDNRVNPKGPVGEYSGRGGASGVTLGPVAERSYGAWTLSGEAGVAYLRTYWHVDDASIEGEKQDINWRHADGNKWTWYAGLGTHYDLTKHWRADLTFRYYGRVHASQAQTNYQYIGLFGGPAYTVLVGASYKF
jgi:opacity protein-like surface antigen